MRLTVLFLLVLACYAATDTALEKAADELELLEDEVLRLTEKQGKDIMYTPIKTFF